MAFLRSGLSGTHVKSAFLQFVAVQKKEQSAAKKTEGSQDQQFGFEKSDSEDSPIQIPSNLKFSPLQVLYASRKADPTIVFSERNLEDINKFLKKETSLEKKDCLALIKLIKWAFKKEVMGEALASPGFKKFIALAIEKLTKEKESPVLSGTDHKQATVALNHLTRFQRLIELQKMNPSTSVDELYAMEKSSRARLKDGMRDVSKKVVVAYQHHAVEKMKDLASKQSETADSTQLREGEIGAIVDGTAEGAIPKEQKEAYKKDVAAKQEFLYGHKGSQHEFAISGVRGTDFFENHNNWILQKDKDKEGGYKYSLDTRPTEAQDKEDKRWAQRYPTSLSKQKAGLKRTRDELGLSSKELPIVKRKIKELVVSPQAAHYARMMDAKKINVLKPIAATDSRETKEAKVVFLAMCEFKERTAYVFKIEGDRAKVFGNKVGKQGAVDTHVFAVDLSDPILVATHSVYGSKAQLDLDGHQKEYDITFGGLDSTGAMTNATGNKALAAAVAHMRQEESDQEASAFHIHIFSDAVNNDVEATIQRAKQETSADFFDGKLDGEFQHQFVRLSQDEYAVVEKAKLGETSILDKKDHRLLFDLEDPEHSVELKQQLGEALYEKLVQLNQQYHGELKANPQYQSHLELVRMMLATSDESERQLLLVGGDVRTTEHAVPCSSVAVWKLSMDGYKKYHPKTGDDASSVSDRDTGKKPIGYRVATESKGFNNSHGEMQCVSYMRLMASTIREFPLGTPYKELMGKAVFLLTPPMKLMIEKSGILEKDPSLKADMEALEMYSRTMLQNAAVLEDKPSVWDLHDIFAGSIDANGALAKLKQEYPRLIADDMPKIEKMAEEYYLYVRSPETESHTCTD